MVARGDLGVEIPLEQIPTVQEVIINVCRQLNKPVIVASQLLESMVEYPTPTRAEVLYYKCYYYNFHYYYYFGCGATKGIMHSRVQTCWTLHQWLYALIWSGCRCFWSNSAVCWCFDVVWWVSYWFIRTEGSFCLADDQQPDRNMGSWGKPTKSSPSASTRSIIAWSHCWGDMQFCCRNG